MNKALYKHPLSSKYRTLFDDNNVNTPRRLKHFFAQAHHEANLRPKSENLNYSVTGLLRTFGPHRITTEQAYRFGRTKNKRADQEAIANIVYGGRWGSRNLGNTEYGDGWKYRGRGIFQVTGKHNYRYLSEYTGIDYLNNPDLLLNESDSLIAALWYWNTRNINYLADRDDVLAVSRAINLGSHRVKAMPHGYNHREQLTDYYGQIFK